MKTFNVFIFCLVAFTAVGQSSFSKLPKVKWKVKIGSVYGSPVADVNTGMIYVAGLDSTIHAIETKSGKEKWKFKTNGPIRSTPLLHNQSVYCISEDGLLYHLDKVTGKVNWRFLTPQGTLQERKYDRADYFQSSATIANDIIYFGMGDYMYAVHATTGLLIWTYKTGNVVHTKPVVANGRVIFGSYDGYAYALNAEHGFLLWKFKSVGHRYFPNGEMMGHPVVSGNTVFMGSRDYNFYAIDARSGYCFWNKQFPRGWALAATVHQDSVVYLGTSDDYLMLALDPRTGIERWRTSLKYNIFGNLTVSEKIGFVGTLMGKLFCLDLTTGNVLWIFEGDGYKTNKKKYFNDKDEHPESLYPMFSDFTKVLKMYEDLGAFFSTPVVVSGLIIVAGADGMLYALE